MQCFLEPDPLRRLLELWVENLERGAGQVTHQPIPPPRPRWLGLRLWRLRRGAVTALVVGLGDGLVELLLQLLLRLEQVAERQLQLARLAALCLVAVDAAFEQLVFVRQVDDGLAQRLVFNLALAQARFDTHQLHLQGRDRCRKVRHGYRGTRFAGSRPGHGSHIHEPDDGAQVESVAVFRASSDRSISAFGAVAASALRRRPCR
jgi:hypothetical protein